MAQPLPAEWIAKYRATWRDAGFVTPDGTLVGQEGRHREMLAELGSDNRPGYEGDAARVAAKYGLVRVTSFHAELAVQLWAMPTADQIAIIAAKAETKPRFSLEVSDSSGESLDWRAWDDRKPGPAAIRSFVANAQRRVRAKDGAAVPKQDKTKKPSSSIAVTKADNMTLGELHDRIRESLPKCEVGEVRTFFRSGAPPSSGVSRNFREGTAEAGVSCYWWPYASSLAGLAPRDWYSGPGRLLGYGSDDEPIVEMTGEWVAFFRRGDEAGNAANRWAMDNGLI